MPTYFLFKKIGIMKILKKITKTILFSFFSPYHSYYFIGLAIMDVYLSKTRESKFRITKNLIAQ